MNKYVSRAAAGLLMFFVALLAAYGTLRLFLHGREVTVPSLAGMSDDDAAKELKKLGLNLSVDNRFYSAAIAPNHVLSQSPGAGAQVRRGWQIRVSESLGGQRVAAPDVSGDTERPAGLVLRRLNLDLGAVSHLPAPGPSDIVLAQSPPANAPGLNGPKISLLVSDDETPNSSLAYVMPPLGGMTVFAANVRLASAGLHIGSAVDPVALAALQAAVPAPDAPSTDSAGGIIVGDPAIPPTIPSVPPPPVSGNAIITGQVPAPGRKVTRADTIRVTVEHEAPIPDPLMGPVGVAPQ